MINNTQPVRLTYQSSLVGYTRGVFYHSGYSDQDVLGKAYWLDGTLQPITSNLDYLYLEIATFQPSTEYVLEAAFFDSMVDPELLEARAMVSISDPLTFTTKEYPTISSYTVTSDHVSVGVSSPILNLTMDGYADSIEVQWSMAGENDWVAGYVGPLDPVISVAGISVGTVDVRARGIINIPDGLGTRDVSDWSYENSIVLDWEYSPPAAPSDLTFTTALLAEPAERYDVLVSWEWVKGTGPDLREFILYSIPKSLYDSNPTGSEWEGATKVNTGTAQSSVQIGHPYELPMKYMVASVAWGPTEENTAYSPIVDFEITAATPIDNDFTTQTGIEVTYAHIKGLLNDGGTWKQTFLIDAATGAVAIGLLDGQGKAPITFDPVSGNVNVLGSVISEEIIAANFVLANLTGQSNPKIYTSSKPEYGDPGQGMFAGYTDTDQTFKFDLGDSQKHIRWDGTTLRISGDVVIGTPGGDVPIGDGTTFIASVFRNGTTIPSTPTDTSYPPLGWSSVPSSTTDTTYVSTGKVSVATNQLVLGEVWGSPVQFTGNDGAPGTPGTPGQDGTNGQTTYFHTAYADDASGGGFSLSPTGKTYIGTYSDFNQNGTSVPSDYTWMKTEGIQGEHGTDGIPGSNGTDGQTSYLHIAYADTSSGGGFSQNPTGKDYIGQYVDFVQQDSSDPDDYTWALIKGADGADGIPGSNGTNGQTTYFHTAYATDVNGGGFNFNPAGKTYIGTYADFNSGSSSNPTLYTWMKTEGIQGETGTNGIPGSNGTDGQTSYLHIAYADTSSGGGFSQSPTGKDYIGQYVDFVEQDSSDPNDYTWSLIKGADGADGIPGSNGTNGQTTYFHTAYATSASGAGFSFSPTGKTYIGTYADFSSGSSSTPSDYTWMKTEGIQGEHGTDGIPGSNGTDGQTSYLHIAYADTSSGGGFSQSPTGKDYIGQYVDFVQQDSTDPDDYAWSLTKGEDGTPGTPGTPGNPGQDGDEGPRPPNFYSQSLSGFSSWSNSSAAALFTQLFGAGGVPVPYDVLTQFNTADPSIFETRQWNGAAWVGATQTIHGNIIVDGSVRAETIVADAAFLQTVGASEIYDDDAFVNGTPELDYTMKISLSGGFIHIR